MEGYRDPFNRRTFPWQDKAGSMQAYLAALGDLRNQYQVLQTGFIAWQKCSERGFSFKRYYVDRKDLLGQEGRGAQLAIISANLGTAAWMNEAGESIAPGQILLEIGEDKLYFSS